MQCKSCGRVIQDPRARFCPDCGQPLAPLVQRPGPKTRQTRQTRRRYEGERYRSPYRWVRWAVVGVVAVVRCVAGAELWKLCVKVRP